MEWTDYHQTAQRRYMNADPETRKASREHWTKVHAENMKSGSPEAIAFSASILAAYDVADAYLIDFEKSMKEAERRRQQEREEHAKRPLWDGRGPDGIQYEDAESIAYWDMRKAENGSIYYLTHEQPRRVSCFCSASRLLDHLRRNAAIKARA